jgi:hypothetical protein
MELSTKRPTAPRQRLRLPSTKSMGPICAVVDSGNSEKLVGEVSSQVAARAVISLRYSIL